MLDATFLTITAAAERARPGWRQGHQRRAESTSNREETTNEGSKESLHAAGVPAARTYWGGRSAVSLQLQG